jgi:succinylglutamic semialdehyde dehydrogenase
VNDRAHYIAGNWEAGGGPALAGGNPTTSAIAWQGRSATAQEIDRAVAAAHDALDGWAESAPGDRQEKTRAVADGYRRRKADLAEAICLHTGKPRWEAESEIDSMINKAVVSIAAQTERRGSQTRPIGATRFCPIGVMAVLGPFNMPGHLPNGHLMPAVLAGNTVVFKPSELTPLVGQVMAEIWEEVGFPRGVFNLIQGGAQAGAALAAHPQVDGVLFTGSHAAGSAIHRALAGRPEKLLALEMGGNNPLVAWDCTDAEAAAVTIIQSAFITSGQRCTCARRLILQDGPAGGKILDRLVARMARVRVGLYTGKDQPFMGTVISAAVAQKLLAAQEGLKSPALIEMRLDDRCPALLRPGLIDVTGASHADDEIFGPLLQVIRVDDFAAAVAEANNTRYGLAAGLLSDSGNLRDYFQQHIRAGVVSVNGPTTGARSDLPFGGLGRSGNHRPSAYYAADYCSDAIAATGAPVCSLPQTLPPGLEIP